MNHARGGVMCMTLYMTRIAPTCHLSQWMPPTFYQVRMIINTTCYPTILRIVITHT